MAIEQFGSMLDFGCGCGRMIRHWHDLPRRRLHGCDYNPLLVAWCSEHLPFAEFRGNALEPPLPYEDDQFDLVYCDLDLHPPRRAASRFPGCAS